MPDQPLIEKPATAKAAPDSGDKIFVMPKKYRGMTDERLHKPEPKPEVKKPAPAVPPPKPAAPPQPPKKKLPKPPKKKKFPVKLAVIGIVIIALFAAAAILVIGSIDQPEDQPDPTPPIVVPDPDPDPDPVPDPDPDPVDPFETDLSPGADSDTDGLTDVEELLYGTDPKMPDTDSDGFLDGNEVYHRYNPNGTAPALMSESGVISIFDESDYSYTIYYPSTWISQAVGGVEEQVIFAAGSGETVQVIVSEKLEEETVIDWFLEQDAEATAEDLLELETKELLTGALSPDRLTAYLDGGNKVYVISYSAGTKATVDYLQTFQMMLNSLVLK